ncbi:MAG: T9SS type A sorting domain-containing protein [Bacteroidetes bacterium]|nr:T9SS type A sorting domain-containing protein [Bacteroidota bacterium]
MLNQSGQYISSGLLNSSLNKLDISNFSVGAYFVQIENQKEILKFIKL